MFNSIEITMDSNIEITFTTEYSDFREFFSENKKFIFIKTIEAFDNLYKNKVESVKLTINAKIDNDSWSTVFNYFIKDAELLKKEILPFFEENEEYEYCGKTIEVYNNLIC